MNQEIKDRWIAALRSGEYEQGRGYLKSDGKFCCLGVLCDLALKDGIVEADEERSSNVSYGDPANSVDCSDHVLPWAVRRWAEIDSSLGDEIMVDITGHPYLTTVNDKGATFEQIAQIIEEQL